MNNKSAFLIFFLFLFMSCSQSLFLVDDSVAIEGLDNGSVVGASFPFRVSRTTVSDTAVGLTVTIKNLDNDIIASYEVELKTKEEYWDKELSFPETVAPGWYRIEFVFTEDGSQSMYKTYTVFYNPEEEPFSIEYMYVRPSVMRPGASGLVQLNIKMSYQGYGLVKLSYPDGSYKAVDVKRGVNEIPFTAPDKEGIYPIAAEFYPFLTVGDFANVSDIPSPFTSTVSLAVQNNPEPLANELKPHQKYYSLYHFRGDWIDDASYPDIALPAYVLSKSDNIAVAYRSGLFGYYIGENDFVDLSLNKENDDIKPLLSDKGWKLELIGLIDFVSAIDADNDLNSSDYSPFFTAELDGIKLVLSVSGDKNVLLSMTDAKEEFSYTIDGLSDKEKFHIEIYPSLASGGSTDLIFMVNDTPVLSIPVDTGAASVLYSSYLSGGNGFSLLVDEFAISSLK